MTVRAKFKVYSIQSTMGIRPLFDEAGKPVMHERGYQKTEPCEMRTITLNPVYANGDPNHENSKFWQASPSGEIKLGTVNPGAWEAFELDKEYYIDFTAAS